MVSGLVTSPCDQLRIFSGEASEMRIASKSVIGLVNSNGLERYKVTLLEFRVLLFGVACRSRHDRSHDPQISGAKRPSILRSVRRRLRPSPAVLPLSRRLRMLAAAASLHRRQPA